MENNYTVKKISSSGGKKSIDIVSEDLTVSEHFKIACEFLKKISVETGDKINDRTFDTLQDMHLLTEAVSKALDILAYSPQSKKALVSKLKTKYGIPDDKAREAAEYAAKRGYIDETYQASKLALDFAVSKKRGKRRIISDLAAKGYSGETARKAADSVPAEKYREAVISLAKRKKDLFSTDPAKRKKAAASLLRQGFSYDEIKDALTVLAKDTGNDF